MANTLTVKLTVTDANGVIPGATASAGINFSFDYTKATRDDISIGAAGTSTLTWAATPKVILVVPTDGEANMEVDDDATGTNAITTKVNATISGKAAPMLFANGVAGQEVDWLKFTETGGATFAASVYSWT